MSAEEVFDLHEGDKFTAMFCRAEIHREPNCLHDYPDLEAELATLA